jgi:hypothetical protein
VKPTDKAAFLASEGEGDEVTNRTTEKPRQILRKSDLATDRVTDADLHLSFLFLLSRESSLPYLTNEQVSDIPHEHKPTFGSMRLQYYDR